ncbi:DUF397 domain-containing protein [Streptomyces sp. NPDC057654]|uniref:DUF397 domain-containing protein n=1 Tax=Streptomyces sp. NPDC057654 TaxID=3346196 RepID=UPI0036C09411
MPEHNWQRSSFCSGGGNNCVELTATRSGGISLRESDCPTTVVTTSRPALSALLRHMKTSAEPHHP